MDAPWFDPVTFGAWFGAIVGGGAGALCGIWGALCGILSPRGKGRKVILGGMFMFVIIGLILSGVGLFALISGQPYGIWYPILMVGLMFSIIPGALIPVIRKNYQQAENRRIAAESIRVG